MMRNWKLMVGAVLWNMNSVDKNNLCILESVPDMKASSLPRFMQLHHNFWCFCWHHVFNNLPLSSLFSKETQRGLLPYQKPPWVVEDVPIEKEQLNASDLATLPSPISNKDQGLVSMWLWRRDIYLNIYASWKAFFNMYAQNITPETKKNTSTNLGKDWLWICLEDPGMVNDFVQCHVK